MTTCLRLDKDILLGVWPCRYQRKKKECWPQRSTLWAIWSRSGSQQSYITTGAHWLLQRQPALLWNEHSPYCYLLLITFLESCGVVTWWLRLVWGKARASTWIKLLTSISLAEAAVQQPGQGHQHWALLYSLHVLLPVQNCNNSLGFPTRLAKHCAIKLNPTGKLL